MIMTNDFPIMLHKYLTNFLPNERGYSENTIKTYRYTFVLFLEYLSTIGIKPNKFELNVKPQTLPINKTNKTAN